MSGLIEFLLFIFFTSMLYDTRVDTIEAAVEANNANNEDFMRRMGTLLETLMV